MHTSLIGSTGLGESTVIPLWWANQWGPMRLDSVRESKDPFIGQWMADSSKVWWCLVLHDSGAQSTWVPKPNPSEKFWNPSYLHVSREQGTCPCPLPFQIKATCYNYINNTWPGPRPTVSGGGSVPLLRRRIMVHTQNIRRATSSSCYPSLVLAVRTSKSLWWGGGTGTLTHPLPSFMVEIGRRDLH